MEIAISLHFNQVWSITFTLGFISVYYGPTPKGFDRVITILEHKIETSDGMRVDAQNLLAMMAILPILGEINRDQTLVELLAKDGTEKMWWI